jgi:hypothetical protein
MIYAREETKTVLEKVSCNGCSFQAIPNMDIKDVLRIARIKNCSILGRFPLRLHTLVFVIILAGVWQNNSSNKKV